MTNTTAPVTKAKEEVIQELDTLADKNVDSTDSDVRYMAYGARLRTALRAGSRYIAYVRPFLLLHSDIDRITPRPVTSEKRFGLSYRLRS